MSPKSNKYRSKNYPNLFRYPKSKSWVFRKYSAERNAEFNQSTGESKSEAKAYAIGLERFNAWMGETPERKSGKDKRKTRFCELSRHILAEKRAMDPDTYRSAYNQIENRLNPRFGHLRLDQITTALWEQRILENEHGRKQKLFNERKYLNEIMRRAHQTGLISVRPEFRNPDLKTKKKRFFKADTISAILAECSPKTRLLAEFVHKMVRRPLEVIQYEYTFFDFTEGKYGVIEIPPEVTKTEKDPITLPLHRVVSDLVKAHRKESKSRYLFPSPRNPDLPIKEYKTGWNAACRRAGVGQVDIKALRSTTLTNLGAMNKSSQLAAKFASTSVEVIDKHYFKPELEHLEEITDAIK